MGKNRTHSTMQVDSFVKYLIDISKTYEDEGVRDVILELIPKDENRSKRLKDNNYLNETWQLNSDERLRTLRLLKERGVIH